jgi:hypothetical protein
VSKRRMDEFLVGLRQSEAEATEELERVS